MTNIEITVTGQKLTAIPNGLLVANSVGQVTFTAKFDNSWVGYTPTIVFAAQYCRKSVQFTGRTMDVPWEVLVRPGQLLISAVGIGDDKRRPTALMEAPLEIVPSGLIQGGPPAEYTPEL